MSFRPWFIANCDEHLSNVEIIGQTFENELLECTDMVFDFNNQEFNLHLDYYVMLDSKVIDLLTGLGGAYCNCCTASEEEGLTVSNIVQGRIKCILHSASKFEKYVLYDSSQDSHLWL